jgi:hypothetical protein
LLLTVVLLAVFVDADDQPDAERCGRHHELLPCLCVCVEVMRIGISLAGGESERAEKKR